MFRFGGGDMLVTWRGDCLTTDFWLPDFTREEISWFSIGAVDLIVAMDVELLRVA